MCWHPLESEALDTRPAWSQQVANHMIRHAPVTFESFEETHLLVHGGNVVIIGFVLDGWDI